MLSTILFCLEKHFAPELVLEYLENLILLPRFSIVSLFLESSEKQGMSFCTHYKHSWYLCDTFGTLSFDGDVYHIAVAQVMSHGVNGEHIGSLMSRFILKKLCSLTSQGISCTRELISYL
jgi:hypothetical protein